MKVIFKWYDLWVGLFIDTKKELLYVFPIPTLGVILPYSKALDLFYSIVGKRFENTHWESGDFLDYSWRIKLFGRYYYRSLKINRLIQNEYISYHSTNNPSFRKSLGTAKCREY